MLAALLPSRLTSHRSRSSVNGTQRPKWANTLPRQAAPHSVACICNRMGVVTLCFTESGAGFPPLAVRSGILVPYESEKRGGGLLDFDDDVVQCARQGGSIKVFIEYDLDAVVGALQIERRHPFGRGHR